MKNKEDAEKTGIPSVFQATYYLSKLVWKAISDVIISAKECMIWLQKVSRLVSDNGLPVTFTTPTGYQVQMNYRQMKKQRVNTRMGESMKTKKVTIQYETNKIDKRKVSNAIAPCWIHAIDGSILAKAVSKASSRGIKSFATVHDSFGVLAPDVQLMNDCVRESFVEIFSRENVLQNFCKEITPQVAPEKRHLIPELPKMRNLDIAEVLKSKYFCS
jgi:DNA-directed RNA polymerase